MQLQKFKTIIQQMEKFLKNPYYQGIMIAAILVVTLAVAWDSYKNPKRNFFGLLNPKAS